jgi:quercetin dioxygenase-like cupin family protein
MRSTARLRGPVLGALVVAGAAAMIGTGAAQSQPPAGGRGGGGFASNFTGTVGVVDSSEMRMSRIRFEAGARTNWHVHSTGQIILIEEGRGRLQERGEPVRDLLPGQPVYTRPNVPHWHGAAPDVPAVQFSVYSGDLTWQEPVTDQQYLGR